MSNQVSIEYNYRDHAITTVRSTISLEWGVAYQLGAEAGFAPGFRDEASALAFAQRRIDRYEEERGQAAYLRALEDEGCPSSWALPYVSVSAPETDW